MQVSPANNSRKLLEIETLRTRRSNICGHGCLYQRSYVLIGDRTGMNREESGAFHTLIASTSSLTSKPLSCGQWAHTTFMRESEGVAVW